MNPMTLQVEGLETRGNDNTAYILNEISRVREEMDRLQDQHQTNHRELSRDVALIRQEDGEHYLELMAEIKGMNEKVTKLEIRSSMMAKVGNAIAAAVAALMTILIQLGFKN